MSKAHWAWTMNKTKTKKPPVVIDIESDDGLGWIMQYDSDGKKTASAKLADKIRFVANKLDDEDAADELHSIADDVEVDVCTGPTVKHIDPHLTNAAAQLNEIRRGLNSLLSELGWIIDDEELTTNDYRAPRKQTPASRKIRRAILEHIPGKYIPMCTEWYQDELKDAKK